jgi:hypothetical protein
MRSGRERTRGGFGQGSCRGCLIEDSGIMKMEMRILGYAVAGTDFT